MVKRIFIDPYPICMYIILKKPRMTLETLNKWILRICCVLVLFMAINSEFRTLAVREIVFNALSHPSSESLLLIERQPSEYS